MSDLISRQDAIDAMATWEWQEMYLPIHFKQLLDSLPTADVVSKEKYDELNERYHGLLESANILVDAVREYERREDGKIH